MTNKLSGHRSEAAFAKASRNQGTGARRNAKRAFNRAHRADGRRICRGA